MKSPACPLPRPGSRIRRQGVPLPGNDGRIFPDLPILSKSTNAFLKHEETLQVIYTDFQAVTKIPGR